MGNDAIFLCVATSEPPHSVTWKFNNVEITNGTKYIITEVSTSVSELRVVNVDPDDDGFYMCDVQNEHGDDVDEARLTVICKSDFIHHSYQYPMNFKYLYKRLFM